jgi:hypothetical protein
VSTERVTPKYLAEIERRARLGNGDQEPWQYERDILLLIHELAARNAASDLMARELQKSAYRDIDTLKAATAPRQADVESNLLSQIHGDLLGDARRYARQECLPDSWVSGYSEGVEHAVQTLVGRGLVQPVRPPHPDCSCADLPKWACGPNCVNAQ